MSQDCWPPPFTLPSPLTTEEIVDDGVGGAVGIHQPVGEGEAGVYSFAVAGLAEHPEHPSVRVEESERARLGGTHRTPAVKSRVPTARFSPLGALPWASGSEVLPIVLGSQAQKA